MVESLSLTSKVADSILSRVLYIVTQPCEKSISQRSAESR